MYPNISMDRLIKFSLIIIGLHTAMRVIIALFFYDQFPIAFLAGDFNQDQMDEYRARVLLPAFFLTTIYFIFRYFNKSSILRLYFINIFWLFGVL